MLPELLKSKPRILASFASLFDFLSKKSRIFVTVCLFTVLSVLSAQEFFEAPRSLSSSNSRWVQMLNSGDSLVEFNQELLSSSDYAGTIRIVARIRSGTSGFSQAFVLLDALPFVGSTVPVLYSVAQAKDGWIWLASSGTDPLSITILRVKVASDGSLLREELGQVYSDATLVGPRLFLRPDGSAILFASQSANIVCASSEDGKSWSPVVRLDSDLGQSINLNPTFASDGKQDVLIFQSLDYSQLSLAGGNNNQLFIKTSEDKGLHWSEARLLSNFAETGVAADRSPANLYDNQSPFLYRDGSSYVLVWIRGLRNQAKQVRYVRLSQDLQIVSSPEKVSNTAAGAYSPQWFRRGRSELISWFSSQGKGSRVWLSQKDAGKTAWDTRLMSPEIDEALYPSLGFSRGSLYLAFHGRTGKMSDKESRIYLVEPDTTASKPKIYALNFSNGSRGTSKQLEVQLEAQADASGIVGMALGLSQDPKAEPERLINVEPGKKITLPPLDQDGLWYISALAQDRAGNWSLPEQIRYNLDTTPPQAPVFTDFPLDEEGYLSSNTFVLSWTNPEPEDVASNEYSLQYLGQALDFDPNTVLASLGNVPVLARGNLSQMSRRNAENGWYLLLVWARDSVGNRSLPAYSFFKLNKFIPSTLITYVDLSEDAFGTRSLSISGRGFSSQGRIEKIVLDRDGLEPWDYEYSLDSKAYTIDTDRLISGLVLDNAETQSYLLGLYHSDRGMTFAPRRLYLEKRGIIKYGNFTLSPQETFRVQKAKPFSFDFALVPLLGVSLLLLLLLSLAAFQLRNTYKEIVLYNASAKALFEGTMGLVSLNKRKVRTMKIQVFGLRVKFTVFFLFLVILVVLLISLPLSTYSLANQQATLAKGLQDRLEVMMESLAGSASNFLKEASTYTIELGQLVDQASVMEEIEYVTISGQSRDDPTNYEAVWATSDPKIRGNQESEESEDNEGNLLVRKIDPTPYIQGRSILKDALSEKVQALEKQFNTDARTQLGTIPEELASFSAQINQLVLNNSADAVKESQRIDSIRDQLRQNMEAVLKKLVGPIRSEPSYDYQVFDSNTRDYIFYRPLYFNLSSEKPEEARYYRGMIRIGVSTDTIVRQIEATQRDIIRNILIFSLFALAGGLLGAVILSSIIVVPIRRLVRGVEQIKDIISLDVASQDKQFGEFLENSPIKLKSRDELQSLGTSISDMVYSLKKGAETNKDLIAGKDIQKMFIPLEKLGKGKGTTGKTLSQNSEIFGYYEGAKGVSGDYFYYQKVSQDVYACIKCDIAGKGIPAALIMVEVATLFLSHFEGWEERNRAKLAKSKSANGLLPGDLVPLVRTINDLVAEREFEGRFAAFNIVMFNERTGDCEFCNAGDNQVYIYRAKDRRVENLTLSNTPAAGQFSTKLFPIQYKEEPNRLEIGDILLMFTDGVEESQRHFRNPDFQTLEADQTLIDQGLVPPETIIGAGFEEFGLKRIREVVEAIQAKAQYSLKKYLNPLADEEITFDFSSLNGSAEETVLALVSVEKVFRLIPDPSAKEEDRILIDKKVDDFLKRIFLQYKNYFRNERTLVKYELYREYTHMKEEAQYDDLTLLAIRKN